MGALGYMEREFGDRRCRGCSSGSPLKDPDIVCLQETKTAEFPAAQVRALGYDVASYGLGRWNGVALLSKVGLDRCGPGL